MSVMGFLVLLFIAAVAGALGQWIAGYSLGGCIMSMIVGFIGAYLGMWLAQSLNLPVFLTINIEGQSFPIVWSVIGSAVLAAVLGLLLRWRYSY